MATETIERPPRFASEREEAEWWDSHPEFFSREIRKAEAEGKLGQGIIKRRMEANAALKGAETVALDREDLQLAGKLAERKGIAREVFLKDLIHAALLKEQEALESSAA